MFSLFNVSKSFGDTAVLDRVSLTLGPHETVGLFGPNGAGKTTLLQLMGGLVTPDEGIISRGNEIVAYLPQQFHFNGLTIKAFLDSRLANEYDLWKVDWVLETVGLLNMAQSQPADALSGGQKTRLGLAALLLESPEPTILLLDEPTNNLDTEGLRWLENFVRSFSGSIVLTSHDRHFLDQTVSRIIELAHGKIQSYPGNYTVYHELKALEHEALHGKYLENQAEKRRLGLAIRREQEKGQHAHSHMKARPDKDKFARDYFQNRVTRNIGRQAKALKTRLEQLEAIEKPVEKKSYELSLAGSTTGSKLIAEVSGITKQFNGKLILDNIAFTIRGIDRIRIRGPNGSGKSTLLNILAGKILPDSGSIRFGTAVKVGYFSQDASDIGDGSTGIAALVSTGVSLERCFRQAMSLHLSPSDLNKPIIELSRGQRAKMSFAKLLLQENQLLILDEPTNHLDINTREAIEAALEGYKGALVVASHDQYFINKLRIEREIQILK